VPRAAQRLLGNRLNDLVVEWSEAMFKRTISLAALTTCAFIIGTQIVAAQKYEVVISIPGTDHSSGVERLKVGEKVRVQVKVTNTTDRKLTVPKGNDWYRPQLIRDGQSVPYGKEAAQRIEKSGEPGGCCTVNGFLLLEPHKSWEDTIDLDYWYGSLEAGQYQLSLERIFFGPESAYSNLVSFEIVAAEPTSADAP
jgi:hypothetical protein